VLAPASAGAEFVIKPDLATMLWLAWRSHLHPFMFLRDKGYTPGRYYVEHFLTQHVAECGGRFLEFGDPTIAGCSTGQDRALRCCRRGTGRDRHDRRQPIPGGSRAVSHPEARRPSAADGASGLPLPRHPRDYWCCTRDSLQLLFGERFRDVAITSYGNKLTAVANYWFWMRDHLPPRALMQTDPDCPTLLAVYAHKEETVSDI
jgi:hypothetical protein